MEEQFFSPRALERPSSDEPEKTPSLPVSNEELATRRDGCNPPFQAHGLMLVTFSRTRIHRNLCGIQKGTAPLCTK